MRSRRQDGTPSRERRGRLPGNHGTTQRRAGALWPALLDAEVLSLDIRRSWRPLFPDADDEADGADER